MSLLQRWREVAMENRFKSPVLSPREGMARLWTNRRHLPARSAGAIAPAGRPEMPMLVSFEGLTPDEQRRALSGFPGGRRFVLAG